MGRGRGIFARSVVESFLSMSRGRNRKRSLAQSVSNRKGVNLLTGQSPRARPSAESRPNGQEIS